VSVVIAESLDLQTEPSPPWHALSLETVLEESIQIFV
jgi:hypothetical protein